MYVDSLSGLESPSMSFAILTSFSLSPSLPLPPVPPSFPLSLSSLPPSLLPSLPSLPPPPSLPPSPHSLLPPLSPPQLLVAHDAPLFVRNIAGQMPCDVAWEAKEIVIAKQLESKMVWDVSVGGTPSHPDMRPPPLIRALGLVPRVAGLEGVHCIVLQIHP